jgi:hypothetical protein
MVASIAGLHLHSHKSQFWNAINAAQQFEEKSSAARFSWQTAAVQ